MSSRSVVVVGAGTVGLVTGLGLARRGFDVTILERGTAPAPGPRDVVYHWCSLPLFADLGMLPAMTSRGVLCPETSVVVLATGESLRVDLGTLADVTEHPFNVHVPQDAMAEIATAAVSDIPGSRLLWGVEVTDGRQDSSGATVRGRSGTEDLEFRADWVIGADGSKSVVRRSLGLSFAGTTWAKCLVSCDLRFDLATRGHANASKQLDPEHGALIAKVSSDGMWRYTSAETRTLPAEQIIDRTEAAVAAALGTDDPHIERIVPYRVHQRSADSFRVGRAVLVGDAAHLTNPTLALGMLSGLYDAKLLIETLPAVDDLGDEILDRYAAERYANFWEVTSPRSSEGMELMYSPGGPAQLEERVESIREMTASRDRTRSFLLADLDCETPLSLDV